MGEISTETISEYSAGPWLYRCSFTFVAAIGIANTMMMSIYERTKEIGIIKVLGCSLANIRTLFLAEAAFIGFLGGMAGLALSYLISWALNHFGAAIGEYMTGNSNASVSYIPVWLAGLALIFAICVGIVAGFFPALRATRLEPACCDSK